MKTLSVYFISFVITVCMVGGCTKTTPKHGGQAQPAETLSYTESKIENLKQRLKKIDAEIAKKKHKLGRMETSNESKVVEKAEISDRLRTLENERHYITKELTYLQKIKSQQ
jgi:hypothetical protein